jgi:hypothetical protein
MSKIQYYRDKVLELLKTLHEATGMLPTSLQFLWYEAISAGIINKAAELKRWIIEAATDLRESGAIPWEWIVDETRSIDNFTGYASIKKGLLAKLPHIPLDPWKGKGILVITESRSLKGVLQEIAWRYRVQIASVNGQCAGFLHTRLAPTIKKGIAKVRYLGDYDFSGGHIEANTRSVLEKKIGRELDWERIALTKDQVEDRGLTVIQKFDNRDKKYHDAVETEALGQGQIIDLLEAALIDLLPQPLERVHAREKRQRRALEKKL